MNPRNKTDVRRAQQLAITAAGLSTPSTDCVDHYLSDWILAAVHCAFASESPVSFRANSKGDNAWLPRSSAPHPPDTNLLVRCHKLSTRTNVFEKVYQRRNSGHPGVCYTRQSIQSNDWENVKIFTAVKAGLHIIAFIIAQLSIVCIPNFAEIACSCRKCNWWATFPFETYTHNGEGDTRLQIGLSGVPWLIWSDRPQ